MKKILAAAIVATCIAGAASAACVSEYRVRGYIVVDDGVILLDRNGEAIYHVKLFVTDRLAMRRARDVSLLDSPCSYDPVFLVDGEVIEARSIRRM
ncbi:hypothetical protein [Ruegeria arenilitoris]|uniref:hypothetical protein n=1 Tax=Ruegeria arenilitoris TaxID=1173585 RepID=UPI00147D8C15|nr:hypothetical protein [Ruegeria arenilitoris]